MNIVDNLYSSGPMAPICQIEEHLAMWTEQRWAGFKVDWIEPIPRSSAFIANLIQPPAVILAAGGAVAGRLVPIIQASANELCHLRWFVIDDIEAQLWELANMARFAPRGGQSGVNLFTEAYDPWLATTTFWVLGGPGDKDARVGCVNISGAAIPQARVGFFGYRYLLTPEPKLHPNARYLPAQGR